MGKGPDPEDVSGRDDQEGSLGLGGSVVSPDDKTQTTSRFLQPDDGFHPRAKLEFPTFDGKEDPLPWLNRCETFFRGQHARCTQDVVRIPAHDRTCAALVFSS